MKTNDEAKPFRSVVKRIVDGDTIVLENEERVRLFGVDAPETHPSEQPYGKEAFEFVSRSIENVDYDVTVIPKSLDKYGRTVATIRLGFGEYAKDLGLSLLQEGLAWAYRKYLVRDPELEKIYVEAEEGAKRRKAGLWSKPNPIDPSEFRKKIKSRRSRKMEENHRGGEGGDAAEVRVVRVKRKDRRRPGASVSATAVGDDVYSGFLKEPASTRCASLSLLCFAFSCPYLFGTVKNSGYGSEESGSENEI